MTSPSKVKGNGFERELVRQAQDSGLPAQRAWGSDGKSLGECSEVDLIVAGKKIQAKRRARIPAWISDAMREVDAAVVRADRGDSIVMITWWEYLNLIKASTDEAGTSEG